jgi:hypothetical protein
VGSRAGLSLKVALRTISWLGLPLELAQAITAAEPAFCGTPVWRSAVSV